MHYHFVMFTPGEKSMIFFEWVFDKSNWVRFTQRNLKGQIETSACMEHPDVENYTPRQLSGANLADRSASKPCSG